MKRNQYRLYIITDHAWLGGRTLEEDTERALRGGATLVQIREKNVDDETYITRAAALKAVCDRYGVPLIINDNAAVAKAVQAAGVHLGASDGSIREARALLGPDAIIGATAKTVETARMAEAAGATYLGSGAVFGTTTKADAKAMTLEQFQEITASVSIPVVAIGGVDAQNAAQLRGCGAAGLCAISSVYGREDIEQAARALRAVADEVCI
ncbi:MAG: thiamine phosphate synthase [Intestinibacillus sp.]